MGVKIIPAVINLPAQLTTFIGRERELAEAATLLARTRLLTLTGAGGSGKTRLSLELATEGAGNFPGGVYVVPLAPIRVPGLVLSSIAQSMGLQDSRDRPLLERLVSHLRDSEVLLVLDNFEQLLSAAPVVSELLRETSAVRIVVTSRAPLHVSGEQEYPVPPLAVPDLQRSPSTADIASCESVHLFAERAAAAVPGFAVDEYNVAEVAQIARRLDGLPLAIELAAARVKVLPPHAILSRLEHSLGLLVGGPRDLPDRQQTLRNTIAWSYDLLGEGARRLLATYSVFRGGASLETIEAVCAKAPDIGLEVLDGLQELTDQSLLRHVAWSGPPRFAMLETIREFATQRLDEMPEATRTREAHAAAFLGIAEEASRQLTGPNTSGTSWAVPRAPSAKAWLQAARRLGHRGQPELVLVEGASPRQVEGGEHRAQG